MTENPFTQAAQRIRDLEAENERLRGALEKIEMVSQSQFGNMDNPDTKKCYKRLCLDCLHIAKSALEGKTSD